MTKTAKPSNAKTGSSSSKTSNNNNTKQLQLQVPNQQTQHGHSSSSSPTTNTRGYQHNLEKRERVKEELEMTPLTQCISLPHCGLLRIPDSIWSLEELLPKLRKLDLSNNHITAIPKDIKYLTNLRELWLSYNPITIFPQEIVTLKKLEVIDIRHTLIENLPTELVDLIYLIEFDWRETPLEKTLKDEHQIPTNALTTLQTVFRNINIRKKTKDSLFALLFGEHYIMDADKSYARDVIATFVDVSNILVLVV